MRKIGFANVSEFSIDEELNIGVYNIGGVDYILLGGEFCAEGVRNFLRPLSKVKENIDKSNHYERSRMDVDYYMDNKSMLKCEKVIKDLRHEIERQKW